MSAHTFILGLPTAHCTQCEARGLWCLMSWGCFHFSSPLRLSLEILKLYKWTFHREKTPQVYVTQNVIGDSQVACIWKMGCVEQFTTLPTTLIHRFCGYDSTLGVVFYIQEFVVVLIVVMAMSEKVWIFSKVAGGGQDPVKQVEKFPIDLLSGPQRFLKKFTTMFSRAKSSDDVPLCQKLFSPEAKSEVARNFMFAGTLFLHLQVFLEYVCPLCLCSPISQFWPSGFSSQRASIVQFLETGTFLHNFAFGVREVSKVS